MKARHAQIDVQLWAITDHAGQVKREKPTWYTPCPCGCDMRDGEHRGWAGYVRAANGTQGVSVWARTAKDIPAAWEAARTNQEKG